MTAFWAGASAELVARFTAKHFVEALKDERITGVTAVPTLFARIVEFAEQNGVSLRSKPAPHHRNRRRSARPGAEGAR